MENIFVSYSKLKQNKKFKEIYLNQSMIEIDFTI